jgi:hypothetical protein
VSDISVAVRSATRFLTGGERPYVHILVLSGAPASARGDSGTGGLAGTQPSRSRAIGESVARASRAIEPLKALRVEADAPRYDAMSGVRPVEGVSARRLQRTLGKDSAVRRSFDAVGYTVGV